ncbi:hypothetical protein ACP26L_23715 [Paenibacillus sp. S-38]|uniref:hypothetical protein n=1 Tax=Paenibacillus sp. S-38 TaxID=3416710 RepID=UPI003CF92B38
MATIKLLLSLLVMGAFFSAAFVLFFQKRKPIAWTCIALGFASAFLFYYAIYTGWLPLPETQ